jgi:hypothetical protein
VKKEKRKGIRKEGRNHYKEGRKEGTNIRKEGRKEPI